MASSSHLRWTAVGLLMLAVIGACDSGRSHDVGVAGDADARVGDQGDGGAPLAPLSVDPPAGPVDGVRIGELRAFLGIPYAEPPTGARRFQLPEPRATWSEPLDASVLPAPCVQPEIPGVGNGSEDCLTLDVWTPAQESPELLPVMFWIHGGGFTAGSGLLPEPTLAARGVVIVAINYRLGPLGFLAHPAFDADGGRGGNQAVADQLLALAWTRDNVEAFGGDPDRVTIFGESAGGSAVCALLATPDAEGLFSRAIVMSGTLCGREPLDLAAAHTQGEAFAAASGCEGEDVAACLRALPAEAFPTLLPRRGLLTDGARWGPVVDGARFPLPFEQAFAEGAIQPVPVMIGANAEEGLSFVVGLGELDAAGYRETVESSPRLAEHADAILAEYPADAYDTPLAALAALTGHRVFNCPARRGARAIAATGVPVHFYHYAHPPALHASELGPLFGRPAPGDEAVASLLKDLWTSFAMGQAPGSAAIDAWPEYDATGDLHLRIHTEPAVESGLLARECDFWDAHR